MEHCTVVVPVFNTAHCILPCIQSLVYQTYEKFDILVVDDGSTDDTSKILELVSKVEPKLSFITLPTNIGVAGATKVGIENAKGSIVTIVDSDDSLYPHALSSTLPVMEEGKYGFVWTQFVCEPSHKLGFCRRLPIGKSLKEALMSGWWGCSHQKFFRKLDYMSTVGLNPAFRISSDFQLALLLSTTKCRVHHHPMVTYRYTTGRQGSITSDGPMKQKNEVAKIKSWVLSVS